MITMQLNYKGKVKIAKKFGTILTTYLIGEKIQKKFQKQNITMRQ